MAKKKAPVKKAPPAKKQVARRVTIPAGKSFITFTPGKPLDAEVVSMLQDLHVLSLPAKECTLTDATGQTANLSRYKEPETIGEFTQKTLRDLERFDEYEQNNFIYLLLKEIRERREQMAALRGEQATTQLRLRKITNGHLESIIGLQSGDISQVQFSRPVDID